MAVEEPRKRRDSLPDQLGAPDYRGDPAPPYIGLAEGMIYASFTIDPARIRPHLPPGLTLTRSAPAIWVIAPFANVGWGLRGTVSIFPGVTLNEHASPDTAEACFIPLGAMQGPMRALTARHYYRCIEGCARRWVEGDLHHVEVRTDLGVALRLTIRRGDQVSEDMVSQDRYIGIDVQEQLVSFVISASGWGRAADLVRLEITEAAPEVWQALRPVALNFALLIPQIILNRSVPEALLPEGALPGVAASRTALLDILDRQSRACGILSPEGRVLHANAEARRLLSRLPDARRDPLRMPAAAVQARFMTALAILGTGQAESIERRFLLPGTVGVGPLILQLAALDPALAGHGTVLALLSDPADQPIMRDPGLLQLLGLTPAEARIAAAVGAGLPPREAALRLGLMESTVRSSLKVIFDKLGVKRQAELVQIVARLEAR